jgi:hypothetical protein
MEKSQRTVALKCQGGRGYKVRVADLLCCSADGSEELYPLIIGMFEKPHCLKGLVHYRCDYKSSKNAWVSGDCFCLP